MNCLFIACNHDVQVKMDAMFGFKPSYCTQQTGGLTRGITLRPIQARIAALTPRPLGHDRHWRRPSILRAIRYRAVLRGRAFRPYNRGDHRSEPHSRTDDWLAHLPADGVRQMCAWERFCVFAREPERRLVGIDCRLTVAGVTYEVDAELAGETVVVWWGLFDQALWAEYGDERRGPFLPVGGAIPLHRYRKHRKSRQEVRADQVSVLAARLVLPRAALSGEDGVVMTSTSTPAVSVTVPVRPFHDPDPFHELRFASPIAARRAIAEEIRLPLAKLSDDDRAFIDALLAKTTARPEILAAVRERFPQGRRGGVG
jgi:hypothetical protein